MKVINSVMTVMGPIPAEEMGFVLPHEHIMVDFGGAATAGKHRYEADHVVAVMTPYLERVATQGVKTFVDCTPRFLGRDVDILQTLSKSTGVQIVTNTGLYNNQYLPDYALGAVAESLADEWMREFELGIEGTAVRPGFIKTAVNLEPNEVDLKLIHAAALAHKATGLPLATHTCVAAAADQVLRVLATHQVDPTAWIFVHAHVEKDIDRLLSLAREGVWIELDGLGFGGDQDHANKLLALLEQGFENQVLLSQDAGWYHVGEPGGGIVVPFTRLQTEFLPLLRAQGVPAATIENIMSSNPAQAFSLRL